MSLDELDNESFNGAELKRTALWTKNALEQLAYFLVTSFSETLFSLGFFMPLLFCFFFLTLRNFSLPP